MRDLQPAELPHPHAPGVPHARVVPIAAALLAVTAAIGGLLANRSATESLALKNRAILLRTQASDTYNFYEARSIKEHVYEAARDANPGMASSVGRKLEAVAAKERVEKAPLLAQARAEERRSDDASARAERLTHATSVMEGGVTLFEVAIAIVSISALTASTFLIGFAAFAAVGGLCLLVYGLSIS